MIVRLIGMAFVLGLNAHTQILKVMVGSGSELVWSAHKGQSDIGNAMAVALLWTISLGGEGEQPVSFTEHREIEEKTSNTSSSPPVSPRLSYFVDGLLTIVARLLNDQSLTVGKLFPSPFNTFSSFAVSDSS